MLIALRMILWSSLFVCWPLSMGRAQDEPQEEKKQDAMASIAEKTEGMELRDGFFPLYWDAKGGKVWMEISRFDEDLLWTQGLASGLGSNDIGLDRGQMGGGTPVRFKRIGPKVLLVQPNLRFRATSKNLDEVRAVTDAFAPSVLFSFKVEAESDGRVLVDMSTFLLRDTYEIASRLQPGTYRFDEARSAVFEEQTVSFPKNTELEVLSTFVRSSREGRSRSGRFFEGVGNVAASSDAVTLRVHHSFVELPGPGYTPRVFDPRAGYFALTFSDYAASIDEPMVTRFVRRHRLEKQDPQAAISEPKEPIVYYLDRGTPEPIRGALLDGARWWNKAFEAAGYRDAFRVEILPEGASSLDVRYNVINWVHRSTRGWSYGGSVTDPRTGEIIKGVVTLGSLRARQDYLIAEGLLAPYVDGDEAAPFLAEWALARIRQLSAHEVGHTLGLAHNYYDSTVGRISVMDYPHPLVTMTEGGELRYDDVYDVGIGEWDKVAVDWGYREFADGVDEKAALDKILRDAWDQEIRFLTNQDIDHNPRADQWSNGTDATMELRRMIEIREHALKRFSERTIKKGAPLATLEEVLVPLYMHHRFQVEAAASALGGVHFDTYAMRGDGQSPYRRVPGREQRLALEALLSTLSPQFLALPRSVVEAIPPRPPGYRATRELFPRHTGAVFDALTPVSVAADHTIGSILQSARCARLVEQTLFDDTLPDLNEVLGRLFDEAFARIEGESAYESEIRRTVQRVAAERVMDLAARAPMAQVRAMATRRLEQLMGMLEETDLTPRELAHRRLLARDIDRHFSRQKADGGLPSRPEAPPGAPIGEPARTWVGPEPCCSHETSGWGGF